jgi:hypothetical protein
VRKYLEELNQQIAAFDFERRYDARSAGGKFPAQAGDYGYWRKLYPTPERVIKTSGFIEAKETEQDFRLPQKNFSKEKISRLVKKQWAGANIVVLVLHTGLGQWRCPPFSIFEKNPAAPSWDLSAYPLYGSVEAALRGEHVLDLLR